MYFKMVGFEIDWNRKWNSVLSSVRLVLAEMNFLLQLLQGQFIYWNFHGT